MAKKRKAKSPAWHNCVVRQLSDLAILAECLCGAHMIMTADEHTGCIRRIRFNRRCPATDLAEKRLKVTA